jgi:hypothetical protein
MTDTTASWTGATTWTVGEHATDVALRALRCTGPVASALLLDAGWASTSPGAELLGWLRRALPGAPVDEVLLSGPITLEMVRTLGDRWRRARATAIVAVGGGTVIDAACLSALSQTERGVAAPGRGRSGLVILPAETQPTLTRLVIPTTIGTGAELSATACCDGPSGKLLVLGEQLRPELAAVDPAATSGLPGHMVREAIVEILARLLVPFTAVPTGSSSAGQIADGYALSDLDTLARHAAMGMRYGFDADTRVALATISAHSHAGWGTLGRGLFASPVWFVATELSAALGISKARATALLLPEWARAVMTGDVRWGGAVRLGAAWNAVVAGYESTTDHGGPMGDSLPADPTDGSRMFCRSLIGPHDDAEVAPLEHWDDIAEQVTSSCLRRWGAGLPMLGRLDAETLRRVVADALGAVPTAAGVS